MALFTETPLILFDTTVIQKGDVIWAKHISWNKAITGCVTSVNDRMITVMYTPEIGNVKNHFVIMASEKDDWEIRWSHDLTDIYEFPEKPSDTGQSTTDDPEASKEGGDSGSEP